MAQALEFCFMEDMDPDILRSWSHGRWWLGDLGSQGIHSYACDNIGMIVKE